MPRLIVGCGYLGLRVAQRWLDAGDEVYAVTRSAERAGKLQQLGLWPVVADVLSDDIESLADLPPMETMLYAVGFDRTAGRTIDEVYVEGLRNVLDAISSETGRIIYVSSTGVYGDNDGDWVDEETPCHPIRAGGKACLAAEQLLMGHRLSDKAIVLRMAGIYGPGRIPRVEQILAGEVIPAPAEGFLNLIHVDDASRVVLAAEKRATPPRTYVVSDGHPCPRRDYFVELARLLNAPAPRFEEPAPEMPVAQRALADKRVRNARMAAELTLDLIYPTYRDGLAAIVRERGLADRA
jgi:nucleoside-diphosphate-sugar epimerase